MFHAALFTSFVFERHMNNFMRFSDPMLMEDTSVLHDSKKGMQADLVTRKINSNSGMGTIKNATRKQLASSRFTVITTKSKSAQIE